MLLKSFIPSLILISTASCAAILRQRDITDVTDAIDKTKADLEVLSDAIDNFKGDIQSGFPILQASWAVQSDITAATDIVNAIEGKLTGEESTTVADKTNDLALNDVVPVLAKLGTDEKIEMVKKLGSSIVAGFKTQVQNLQTASAELLAAIVEKLADTEAPGVQESADKVNASFDELIAKIPA